MPAPLAIFRADAGPAIGAGHVMRCLTLADALADLGWRCAIAGAPGTRATIPAASARHVIEDLEDCSPPGLRRRWPQGCDLLVVDHYGLGREFEALLRGWAGRLAAIDDLADRVHDVDMLLDHTPGRDPGLYKSLLPDAAQVLGGPQFALLRPQFVARRPAEPASPKPLRRVLVALGSTDPDNATTMVLDDIARAGLGIVTDVVLGPNAPHLDAVRARCGADVRLHVGVRDMAALMAGADLAIGAPGVTALEWSCLGLPSLLLLTADNQRGNEAGLCAAGAAISLGFAAQASGTEVAEALNGLADPSRRAAMAAAALRLVDGRGARRAAAALSPAPVARDGKPVTLHPAVQDDWRIMLEWQSHPDTRRHFRNPEQPDEATHRAWLARQLARPLSLTSIVLHGGEPAGVVRLDPEGEAFEVSILVAPDRHGLGIGRAALEQAVRLVPECDLKAEVLPGNQASHALFKAAGFHETAPGHYDRAKIVQGNAG